MSEFIQQPNFSEATKTSIQYPVLPIGIEPKPGYELVRRNEDGFVTLLLPVLAPVARVALWPLRKTIEGVDYTLGKVGVNHPRRLRLGAVGVVALTAATAFTYSRSETFLESGIDDSKANDVAKVSVFDFSQVGDIRAAVSNSYIDFTRSNTIYNLATPVVDLIPDFPRTKRLQGTVASEVFVPLVDDPKNKVKAAIEQKPNPLTNKVDIVVNFDNVTASFFYPGSGPVVENGKIKDGKFDPNDDQTRKDAFVGWVGASSSIFKIDGLRKTIENLDENVENRMEVGGLNYVKDECSDGLKPAVKEAINTSLTTLVVQLGRPEDLGDITFTAKPGKWVPKIDPYTDKVLTNGKVTGALDNKNPSIDKKVITCDYDAVPTPQNTTEAQ